MKPGIYPVVNPVFPKIRGSYEDDRTIDLTLSSAGENGETVVVEAQFPLSDPSRDNGLVGHVDVSGERFRARCFFEAEEKKVMLEVFA